ncbi:MULTISPECIES: type IV secretion system protein [Neisseria]|jgi:tagB6|uniref:type IV secretion system protein n=1 Tax=Neisseria TaxID=482 RepID=UPI00066D398A|nr:MULTISPECIES: type IV secretion system protein [Neisseria]MBS4945192.1 type IV secretion system protein [Neisseria mucosa]MBF1301166.1 type IV secretion system protein [Neisseria sp.]MBY6284791.1 type IV secretion system protein [Neisseria subflava]MCL5078513.1 type IV secretion system protein [Neisseria perflava]MDU8022223.1 type IV secretion system protein [Neisseria sp.]
METTSYFSELANFLLNGMGTNLFQKSNNMISGIAPVFQIGFGIYILLIAFDYYKRGFDENVVDLGKRMIGWLLIIAFAFNSSQYQKLANIMWMLPENLSGLLGTSTYTASALDTQSNNILKMMENIFAYASSLDMLQVSDKLMLYIGGTVAVILAYLFFLITFAYYLIAKLSLAMVIVIGPMFIGSMLFPATRQWGMNWIGQILNYSVTVVFYVILGALQNDFFKNQLERAVVGEIGSVAQVVGLIPLFFLSTTIFILVAWSIPSISSALTGGASVNGFSRTVMSVARWAKGVKLPGGGKVKPK